MELGKLGTVTVDGESNYDPRRNPLLSQGVIGVAPNGFGQAMHPMYFATPAAAAGIAAVVQGEVVRDPMSVNWNTPGYRCLAIQVGDKVVNAGNLCTVLGNDNGETASPRQKSAVICDLLGLPLDLNLADKLYDELVK